MVEAATIGARRGMRLVAEYARRIGETMEHEMAMRQMRAHLARAGREIQSARQFLETPTGRGTNLALARALANARLVPLPVGVSRNWRADWISRPARARWALICRIAISCSIVSPILRAYSATKRIPRRAPMVAASTITCASYSAHTAAR